MKFGHLGRVYGIVEHKISPHELNPFKGIIKNGFPNTIRRIRSNLFTVAPPFVVGYTTYEWLEREHRILQRKNPDDYVNDV